ncbi:MAG: NTP/NDP exchange transporter [Planctomycetota bacterium]|jgi:AAA family ATP:ADP antiporter
MPEANHKDKPQHKDPRRGGALSWQLVKVEPAEVVALLWSCAYFFCLLSGYYILRPLRDAMGAAGGVRNLKWLYLGTLSSMLIASFIFAALTTRFPRRKFIPYVYRFFVANILVFFVLLRALPDESRVQLGRVFFVWVSVFNLFVVSVFWSFMADLFSNPQGKRLFGFIAVGGTLGQVCGAFLAGHLAQRVGAVNMLLLSALLLEAACWCVRRLSATARSPRPPGGNERPATVDRSTPARPPTGVEAPIGGGPFSGLGYVLRSPYLLGICLFMLCYTISSTFLYVTKLNVGIQQSTGEDARVAFFANIDFWTGVVTVLAQIFLTSRLIGRFGVGWTLGVLPIITGLGFACLGVSLARPELVAAVWVLVGFEALRRAGNFAFSRPAREVLYTVVRREEKYKSKNFIDTFVYRLGDQIGAWTYDGILALKLGAAAAAFAAVPLAGGWLVVAMLLGRRQRSLAKLEAERD